MRNRGSASVLAMIFLVVFGALSCAFFVMINTSLQVAKNDRNSIRARAAAESGMEVVKHHLSAIKLPGTTPDTAVMGDLATALETALATSPDRVDPAAPIDSVELPNGWDLAFPSLKLDPAGGSIPKPRTFAAHLFGEPNPKGLRIIATVEGIDTQSKLTRSVAAVFYARPAGRSIFEFDMAAAGGITVNNGTIAGSGANGRANVMSASDASPSIHIENSTITGGLAVVISEDQLEADPRGKIEVTGLSDIGEIKDAVNVTDRPSLPGVYPEQFRNLVPLTPVDPGSIRRGGTFTNVVINSAPSSTSIVRVTSGTTLNGIIYVKSPNKLEFGGNVTLNGIIVFERPADPNDDPGDYLKFTGSLDQSAAAAASFLPPDVVKAISGVTIMAPQADVVMTGSASMQTEGSIICDTFYADSAGFDLNVNDGTILTLSPDPNSLYLKNGTITFTRTKALPPSTGIIFDRQYVMDPRTYEEAF